MRDPYSTDLEGAARMERDRCEGFEDRPDPSEYMDLDRERFAEVPSFEDEPPRHPEEVAAYLTWLDEQAAA